MAVGNSFYLCPDHPPTRSTTQSFAGLFGGALQQIYEKMREGEENIEPNLSYKLGKIFLIDGDNDTSLSSWSDSSGDEAKEKQESKAVKAPSQPPSLEKMGKEEDFFMISLKT